jgi:hypothetical protein
VGSVLHGVGRGSLDVGGWKKRMLQKNLRVFRRDGSPKMFHSRYLSKAGVTQFSVRLNSLGVRRFCPYVPLAITAPNDIYC